MEGLVLAYFNLQWPKLKFAVACLDCVHFGTDGRAAAYYDRKCKPYGQDP
jgi:hypothetical protein